MKLSLPKNKECLKIGILKKINKISREYNIEPKNIIKNYLNYIIRQHPQYINSVFLNFIENIVHIQECKTEYLLQYFVLKITTLIGTEG